ncbi:MAG TPA: hypothetical protein PK993_03995 [Clostridia bacterium]|nr:hypothetical protein [Clostridia bacterium]
MLNLKIVELNNKSRKGKYVSIYNEKTKKNSYYKFIEGLTEKDYFEIYGNAKKIKKENPNQKVNIKKYQEKLKNEIKEIKEIITKHKKDWNKAIFENKEKLLINQMKKGITAKIEFEYKDGFDDIASTKKLYAQLTDDITSVNKMTKKAEYIKYVNEITIELIGDDLINKKENVKFGEINIHNMTLSELKIILGKNNPNNKIYNYKSDLLSLAKTFKTKEVNLKDSKYLAKRIMITMTAGRK